jgi:hypothetical protein
MVWNGYLRKPSGAPADLFVGQSDSWSLRQRNHILGRSMHAVDHRNRLWATGEHGKLMAYQLPLRPGSRPLRTLVPLHWADEPGREVEYEAGPGLALEARSHSLSVSDGPAHRLRRVRLPGDLRGKLLVDAVLGQKDRSGRAVNRGMARPDAACFGDVNDVKFDHQGNLFVVDNTYELHANGRVLAFLSDDLAGIRTMFPDVEAKKVYVAERFDQPVAERTFPPGQGPRSLVCLAFNSRNEMVLGNDGYYAGEPRKRNVNQLFLYRRPLAKATPGAVIELPLGAPGEIAFDDHDNLIVQDHTYNKLWVLNFDRDPAWLRPLE